MINIIKFCFVFVTGALLLELIYKSKQFSVLRMNVSIWQIVIEIKCILFMKKYKCLYRIIIELFFIWFVFEWNNKLIISSISHWGLLLYVKLEPIYIKIKEICIFLSPYGRNVIKNDIVFKWMKIFSIGLLIVFILHIIIMLLGTKRRLCKIFFDLIALMIDWYVLLFSAFIISKIPQEHIVICWGIAIIFFGIIQVTIFGILSEVT